MRILFVVIVGVLLGAAGCKKPKSSATEDPAPTGKGNTNYIPGAGPAINTLQAGGKPLSAINDMHQIGIMIDPVGD